jgi:hypothetical protein
MAGSSCARTSRRARPGDTTRNMVSLWSVPRSHVRFGSLADICSAKGHVRFAPDSDRESGFPRKVMSALPPKADMCGALANVRYGPKADIGASMPRGDGLGRVPRKLRPGYL